MIKNAFLDKSGNPESLKTITAVEKFSKFRSYSWRGFAEGFVLCTVVGSKLSERSSEHCSKYLNGCII